MSRVEFTDQWVYYCSRYRVLSSLLVLYSLSTDLAYFKLPIIYMQGMLQLVGVMLQTDEPK